ncbi:MAG: type I 3-dehydroquinate dehydratase, partial [Terriglobales bacterium]
MPPRMVLSAASSQGPLSNRVSPGRIPRLCIAVQAPTPGELIGRAERAARENGLLELRLDALKQPSAAIAPLREFLRSSPQTLVIATCRKQTYGGGFKEPLAAQWRLLREAAAAGSAMVDLELQSAERLPAAALQELRQQTNLMVSYHDFKTTPALAPVFKRLQAIPADLYKLVPTATVWRHNLELLRFVEAHSGEQTLVGFCMGEAGLLSRLLCLRSGSAFTFASLESDQATASGQPELGELRQLYRIEGLSRATRVFGVLGYPLAHTLSPRMHNAAYRRAGENAIYLPLPCRRPEEVLDRADEIPLSGFSVTHPYKSAFLRRLERMDALAQAIGAINTVVRSQGKFYGYNTDVAG